MVPLAWALRLAGHEVRIAGRPSLLEAIGASGLTAVPVSGSEEALPGIRESVEELRRETGKNFTDFGTLEAMPPEVERRFLDQRRAALVNTTAEVAEDLVGFARAWRPDLVVSDPVMLAGALVAGAVDIPLVHHMWGPLPPTARQWPGCGLPVADWPESLRALFDRFGVEARASYAVATIDPCPPGLGTVPVPDRLGMRHIPYNGPGSTPDWLREPAERPRVCVSWSMSHTETSGERTYPAAAVAEALTEAGAEVVATVRASDRDGFGPVPEGVRLVEELPLQLLIPSCAAAVNHGGTGTVLTVAACGVPQVLLPLDPVHTVNADWLAAAGAGVRHASRPVEPEQVAASVADMLSDDSWQRAALAVRDEIAAQPGPADVVRTLEQLADSRGAL
jgi:UDP:flavonoid glycosyltransferase YjiC (YdhE family)